MTTPITVQVPHALGRAEARRRLEAGFGNLLREMPGAGGRCHADWDGDRMAFGVTGMGQTVSGTVEVADAMVTITVELPGLLGVVAGALGARLQKAGRLLLTK